MSAARCTAILLLAALLAGCNLPVPGGTGPRAWIDFPVDGMSFTPGTLVVQSHSSGPAAIRQVELFVNGASTRTDLNPDQGDALVALSQAWTPPGPGAYTLELTVFDVGGGQSRSRPVHILVVGCPTPVGGGPSPADCSAPPPAEAPTATFTPEPGPAAAVCTDPTVNFTQNTNCRAGPSTSFEAVDAILAGASAPIVGRSEDGNWWMVQPSGGGTCWVGAGIVSACGETQSVGVVTVELPAAPPPPAAQGKPAAPSGLAVVDHVCQGSTYAVTLGWNDAADNEDGYRVYRNNALVATLGADAEGYSEDPPVGGPYTYKVEAFNGAGASSASTQDAGCIF